MTPFRYGTSFFDRETALRFEAHHPASRPDRWRAYFEGLTREYGRRGVAGIVDHHALERGEGVSLFFVGVGDDDRVVAGVRCHGPLEDAEAVAALGEMAGSPELEDHRAEIEAALPYGVIEIKGAWREANGHGRASLFDAHVRCAALALEWLNAEVMIATVADRLQPQMESLGSIMMGTQPAPFPNEHYRTVLSRMRRARYNALADEAKIRLLREDAEQLHRQAPRNRTTGWRPVLLDVRKRADRQVLANLRADPGIDELDLALRQREELEQLLPAPDAELLDEPTVHVYYPWRGAVVHMLGPRGFAAVRLDRNRQRITTEEQRRLRRQRVGVVGLSAGLSAAATIALEGLCGELRLADFDDIDLSNLNRLPASVLDVGTNKSVVAARRVAEIDPYLPVHIVPAGLSSETADEFVAGLDVLVEECDDLALKVSVREVARRQRVAVVMETSDRGMLDVERFDLEPERPVLHGLLGDIHASSLVSLSVADKVPYVLAIVDPPNISARAGASLAEVGHTLSTWPQLGSDVTLGGATVAAAVRRIGLGEDLPSGRTRVDLDRVLSSLESPARSPALEEGRTDDSAEPATTSSSVPADPLLAVAHAAAMAPSCGNKQPWRFELTALELAIELEASRGCGAMDVSARASYVGIGAALFNARVAAAAGQRLGPVTLFPEGAVSDVVATLEFAEGSDDELAALYGPMLERCSNRRHGVPAPLDLDVVATLSRAASCEGATLHVATGQERIAEWAELLAATERIRFLTPALLKETVLELRWPGEDARTGVDLATLEFSKSEAAALELMRRPDVIELLEQWDAGDALGDYLERAVLSSSAIAVLTVADSSPASYLRGGMALERVWIEAQRSGLGVHAIAPTFLYAVQQRDFDALGGARWAEALRGLSGHFRTSLGLGDRTTGILVLRLSHAPAPKFRSTRLPLSRVVRRRGVQSP